jgi:hypothetical protein
LIPFKKLSILLKIEFYFFELYYKDKIHIINTLSMPPARTTKKTKTAVKEDELPNVTNVLKTLDLENIDLNLENVMTDKLKQNELKTKVKNNTIQKKEAEQRYVNVQDILDSAEKYGNENVLNLNYAKARDLKKLNKKAKYDCTYVPLNFKFVSGKEIPFKLKFSKIITASGAKVPSSSKDEDDEEEQQNKIPKNLLIAFRTFSKDEIEGGDYVPKEMNSEAEQDLENQRMEENIATYLKSTNDFSRAMEIIELSYHKCCEDMKNAKSLGFTVKKDKKFKTNSDVYVYPFRQTTRENKKYVDDPNNEPEEIELEHPIARIKLMLAKDGRVGNEFYNKDTKASTFNPVVFDSRKMTKKNNYEPVLAKVKYNGKMQDLNIKNAGTFITYKSMVGGIIEFSEVVVSKFGLSLRSKFRELYVRRHKSNTIEPAFSKDDIKEMHGGDEDESSDSDVEFKNDEETSKKDVESDSDLDDKLDDAASGDEDMDDVDLEDDE